MIWLLPFGGFLAVKVVDPIADPVLLVEGSSFTAHVGDAATIFVAHVEEHAFEFLIGVESNGAVGAVESQCHVRELFPAF